MVLNKIILIVFSLLVFSFQAHAQTRSTAAKHAILLDLDADQILFEKDADSAFPPASMSKLMTVYVAFKAVKQGDFNLDDEVIVSDSAWKAWNNRGSTMFLGARDKVTIKDLLRGIIVLSGNDACVVLAEEMAGDESLFVEWMNAAAADLGMTSSHFVNTNGWPADGHVMSARDLAILAKALITEFPDLYPLFQERRFQYKNYTSNVYNRNPLLGSFPGADGLKTGHTSESGYGLTASALRDGRRLVLVLGGLESASERSRESNRMLQYGFRNFDSYPLFRAGDVVDYAEVWLGSDATVPLTLDNDLRLVLSRNQRSKMAVKVSYLNPLPAPIAKGQVLGQLVVETPGREPLTLPLKAGKDVGEIGGLGRVGAALDYFLFGTAGQAVPE